MALFLILTATGLAQDYRGRIEGVVTDETKATIPGSAVTLLNVNTGVRVVKETTDTGLYLFDLVDPGTYSITIDAKGFNRFIQENVIVQTRGDITVNAMLKPGTAQESVTVNEAPAAVEFNSANRDFTIDTKLVEEIPRFDRIRLNLPSSPPRLLIPAAKCSPTIPGLPTASIWVEAPT